MADAEGVRAFRLRAVWGHVVTGKTDNLKLTDEQKTRLLNLALEAVASDAPGNADEAKGDLLCDILRCPLPPTEHPSDITRGAATGFGPTPGPSLGQLLNDPRTDVAVLRRIKDYTKVRGKRAGSDVEKDVFLAVYFAAIAAALVFHDKRITGHSSIDLAEFLALFGETQWIPADLRRLFHIAGDRFREMKQQEV